MEETERAQGSQCKSPSWDRNGVLVSVTQVGEVAHLYQGELKYRFLGVPPDAEVPAGGGLGIEVLPLSFESPGSIFA